MKSLFIFFTGMPLGYALSEAVKIGSTKIIVSIIIAFVGWLGYIVYMQYNLSKISEELKEIKDLMHGIKRWGR